MVGPLALIVAVPATAAEPASSVSFVNRDALTATTTNGWRNPLRANTPDAEEESGNSLRQEVSQVSYEEEVGNGSRSPNSLQRVRIPKRLEFFPALRVKAKTRSPSPASRIAPPTSPNFARRPPLPRPQSRRLLKALSMLPQFQSSAARQQSAQDAAKAQAAMTARAGSARPRPTPACWPAARHEHGHPSFVQHGRFGRVVSTQFLRQRARLRRHAGRCRRVRCRPTPRRGRCRVRGRNRTPRPWPGRRSTRHVRPSVPSNRHLRLRIAGPTNEPNKQSTQHRSVLARWHSHASS